MRIGLLIPANLYFAPYVKIYTTILDALQVNYDLIYFDKKGLNEPAAHRFSLPMDATASQWKRLVNYIRYSCFLRKTIKREAYDKLIVFGPQIGIFLYGFLKKHYRHRFILDYRDLSIEQRFKKRYEALLKISSFNVISSPGFKRCLPENFDYILSHNFDINILTQALLEKPQKPVELMRPNQPISVLTIGGIRDYEQNAAVMMALANNPSFRVAFVGRGEENADVKLKELAEKNHVTNVHFQGYYEKKDEPRIVQESTFLNIFYPRKLSHDTALSNRFYNSLIFRKPMITTANTIQGDYAAKYGVGIAIDNTDQLGSMLETYVKEFDASKYETNRNQLLQSFKQDYDIFKKAVVDFATQR